MVVLPEYQGARGQVYFFTQVPLHFQLNGIPNNLRPLLADVVEPHAGMGLGTRLSDLVGQLCLQSGYTMYAKTKHPRLGGWVSCKNGVSS